MRQSSLATMTLALTALWGCGTDSRTNQPDASPRLDSAGRSDVQGQPDASLPREAFELEGKWLYLGPWDGEHTLEIGKGSLVYAAITGDWSSSWTIKEYDNGLHHFQIVFASGTGTYYPVGQSLSGTYVKSDVILTVQLADGPGSYPSVESPGSCTKDDGTFIPDCRLYMKQN
jgi:hypothetical protein